MVKQQKMEGVYFEKSGNVTNCNFTNNTATYGGAVYFEENTTGSLIKLQFIYPLFSK